jgi:hypothetical protein
MEFKCVSLLVDQKPELQDQSHRFEGGGIVNISPDSLRVNANRTAEIFEIASAMSRRDSVVAVLDPTWGRTFVFVHRDVIFCSISNVRRPCVMIRVVTLMSYTWIFA